MTAARDIAQRAAELVSGERDRQHGDKADTFGRIASYWETYLTTRRDDVPLTPTDVAHMMLLMKLARTQSGAFNADDFVDMAGYAACAGELQADVAAVAVPDPTTAVSDDLRCLIAAAQARYDALSPEEQAEADKRQRESWVRGQIGMGSDRDEAEARHGIVKSGAAAC